MMGGYSGHIFIFITVKHGVTRRDEVVSYNVFVTLMDQF